MPAETWTAVDDYFVSQLLPPDRDLDRTLHDTAAAGLPPIQVAATQGRLLTLLATLRSATNVLEIGTLGGYSTLCLARGVAPGGKVTTLELEEKHAEVARNNLRAAGVHHVTVLVGPALQTLPRLAAANAGPFDLVFIDADKESSAEYFDWALRLSKVGTLILIDNVVRGGAVTDAASTDPAVLGTRRVIERLGREPRVIATALQTVGHKGYDGLAMALVVR